jgi:hypothetical protein
MTALPQLPLLYVKLATPVQHLNGNARTRRKSSNRATECTTNSVLTAMGLYPSLRGERLSFNRLRYGMSSLLITLGKIQKDLLCRMVLIIYLTFVHMRKCEISL